jgi:protein transport protein SEC13
LFKQFQNDYLGCNSVSWAPYNAIGSILEDGTPVRRLVTGGCDNVVRIWRSIGADGPWTEEARQTGVGSSHTDWVRDVAWAPNTAVVFNTIASCSEDRTVIIWKQATAGASWQSTVIKTFEAPAWRVSWSVTGNILAVSTGDHKVSLWKQSVDESWVEVSSFDSTKAP